MNTTQEKMIEMTQKWAKKRMQMARIRKIDKIFNKPDLIIHPVLMRKPFMNQ